MKLWANDECPLKHSHSFPLDMWRDLKIIGIGCCRMKARAILDAADRIQDGRLNLRKCSPEDLEAIYGIEPKTARAFIMWSRPGESYAILDTHILKWLKEQGIENVPKATPTSKNYDRLEAEFLDLVPEDKSAAEFDLQIWKKYANPNTGVTTVY